MPQAINSFDVFDTLITRRCVEPGRVLQKLEQRAGMPGLAAVRIDADRRLGAVSKPYGLDDIWDEVRRLLALDHATVKQLLSLEVEIEHNEAVPIVENLALVRDGDLLISDTYLSAEIVHSLLRRVGFHCRTAVVTTNDGKFRGWVWTDLKKGISIGQHFGDNPHSDGQTPTEHGIKAIIYTGARRSPIEQMLAERGYSQLANLIREARLANPYSERSPQHRHLWSMACQLNFPLLLFSSHWLERYARENRVDNICFVSRDCLLWQELFRELFPRRKTTYLFASRLCQFQPSPSYLEYFQSTWHPDSLIVDLLSTGTSWAHFFGQLQVRGRGFFIAWCDNFRYIKSTNSPLEWLEIASVFRTSELEKPATKGIEMLNYAPHPSVEDVHWLLGGIALPVLAQSLEYDRALPDVVFRAFATCRSCLKYFPDLVDQSTEHHGELIRLFAKLICGDRHLPAIYPNHYAADLAYEKRLASLTFASVNTASPDRRFMRGSGG